MAMDLILHDLLEPAPPFLLNFLKHNDLHYEYLM